MSEIDELLEKSQILLNDFRTADFEDLRDELKMIVMKLYERRHGIPREPRTVEAALERVQRDSIQRLARLKRQQILAQGRDAGALEFLDSLEK